MNAQAAIQAAAPLTTGEALEYLDMLFAEKLGRTDFRDYIDAELAGDFAFALSVHVAALETQIAELKAQLATEVERLDFVLRKYAYCAKFSGCVNTSGQIGDGYQLIVSDEEVDCIALSGEDVNYPTPRAAIDAAIKLSEGGA